MQLKLLFKKYGLLSLFLLALIGFDRPVLAGSSTPVKPPMEKKKKKKRTRLKSIFKLKSNKKKLENAPGKKIGLCYIIATAVFLTTATTIVALSSLAVPEILLYNIAFFMIVAGIVSLIAGIMALIYFFRYKREISIYAKIASYTMMTMIGLFALYILIAIGFYLFVIL